ncbi:CYTH and CHAD domain-containing protein [Sinomonas terrae]|uniref:CYTH and CHAD domain-containing protein n=1 Tax=Sinomonas terrae TaxID=2908838 RepID=A0ABS9TVJ3_9MICC|nr:CYTH and CHAD domain-containing protein [Sinomonas terrae]MCH6468413.1 CYTH and CHAD domain-containing protein [Sinomonas terrae]
MARTRLAARGTFDASVAGRFPEFDALSGVAQVRSGEDLVFEEQFFDTEDFRLGSHGIVLYRRTGGPREGWHLELPDGRTAVEPLGSHQSPPPSLTDGLQFYLRGEQLVRSADVTIVRRVALLLADDGGELAEAADEHHRAEPLIADGAPRAWRLWDYEVREPGNKRLAKELCTAFAESGAEPGSRSSSLLTLAASVPPRGREAEPEQRRPGKVQRAFADYVAEQLEKWERLDPEVRLAAPDSVHNLRIATRRLRSCLSAFRKDLDPDSRRAMRDELQWFGRVLGRVRDAEIMRERLRGRVGSERSELVFGPVRRSFDESLGAEHAEASRELRDALGSERYFRLLDGITDLAATVREADGKWETKATVSGVVRRDAKRLRAAVEEAKGAEGTEKHDIALHDVRKAAKRLRYSAEAAAPFGAKKAARLGRRARKVQKALGEHQDSIVTAELVRRLGVEAYGRAENAFTYGRLHARELQLADEAEARYDRIRRKLPAKLGGGKG